MKKFPQLLTEQSHQVAPGALPPLRHSSNLLLGTFGYFGVPLGDPGHVTPPGWLDYTLQLIGLSRCHIALVGIPRGSHASQSPAVAISHLVLRHLITSPHFQLVALYENELLRRAVSSSQHNREVECSCTNCEFHIRNP